ncbi:type II secretion system protein GspL [Thalassotalea sp. Y01]|uniref:type II secretion system protein GspL n=1 Tax=Thalassotalea sp. Y01 TaxID=2729613 RepID=UPI00145D2A2D|nr:type II secretion system protein GspL [Thalassotalea sp. Y01]NMP17009.1 type II secretion system protein GspL [Thalassotalea sp. Y01]
MRETLFIRISAQPQAPLQWLILSHEHEDEIASGELDSKEQLATLLEKAEGRQLTVLVDSTAIGLRKLKVPGKNDRSIRAATPYMLEEELAEDVDELFFAYANKPKDFQGDENCFVAYSSHQQINTWLSWFEEAGLVVKRIIPDVLCMPLHDGLSMVAINDQCLLRYGGFSGFVVDKSLLPLAVEHLAQVNEEGEDDAEPMRMHCYSPFETELESVDVVSEAYPLPLLLLARHSKDVSFNLLQGDFQVKEKRSPHIQNWLWVAGIAAFALLLNLIGKVVQLNQLENQYTAVGKQIEASYKKAFPKTKRVRLTTVKSQIERQLQALGASGEGNGFLPILADVQPAFADVPQIKPSSIRFDGKRQELRLSVVGNDYQSFERFKQKLESSNFDVKVGAQNNQGDQISGSFNIRSKS